MAAISIYGNALCLTIQGNPEILFLIYTLGKIARPLMPENFCPGTCGVVAGYLRGRFFPILYSRNIYLFSTPRNFKIIS